MLSATTSDETYNLLTTLVQRYDASKSPVSSLEEIKEVKELESRPARKPVVSPDNSGSTPEHLMLQPRPTEEFSTDNMSMSLLVEKVFPVGPYGFFEHTFGSHGHYSIVDHHTYVGETEAVISRWRPETGITSIRDFYFRTAINGMLIERFPVSKVCVQMT